MSDGTGKSPTRDRQAGEARRPGDGAALANSGTALAGPGGRTSIADEVVAKIAGMAAREIGGVHAMGAGMGRAFGSVKERIGMSRNVTQGVAVEVGERQTAVDIDLIVEYGESIPDLATAVRQNVIKTVEQMCGLEVVEVNVAVDDIHLPGEEEHEGESRESREPRETRGPRESRQPRVQ